MNWQTVFILVIVLFGSVWAHKKGGGKGRVIVVNTSFHGGKGGPGGHGGHGGHGGWGGDGGHGYGGDGYGGGWGWGHGGGYHKKK